MQLRKFEAKLHFAEAFVDLVERGTGEAITVGLVAESIGKHRKTFYYHFASKEQLVIWLFRYDLGTSLVELFPEETLVWEADTGEGSLPDFPYYIHQEKQSCILYNALFFEVLASSLEKRRAYYRSLFADAGRGTLQDYIYTLYRPQLESDLNYMIDTCLAEELDIDLVKTKEYLGRGAALDFVTEYFTGAFIYRLTRRLNFAPTRRTLEDIKPFENITHDCLYLLIREHARSAFSG